MKAVQDNMPTGPGTETLHVGPGRDQARRRRRRGDVRRQGLPQDPVQHRDRRHDAGRVDVQGLHPDRRARSRASAPTPRSTGTARSTSPSSDTGRPTRRDASRTSPTSSSATSTCGRRTAHSVNTVYAQLNIKVGPDKTKAAAVAAGLPAHPACRTTYSNVFGTANAARHRHGQRLRHHRRQGQAGDAVPHQERHQRRRLGELQGQPSRPRSPSTRTHGHDATEAMPAASSPMAPRLRRRRSAGRPRARPVRRPRTRRRGSTASPPSSPPRSASTATVNGTAELDEQHPRLSVSSPVAPSRSRSGPPS